MPQVVAIGNHRDAWILGASDPSSGTAVTHEVYKGLGALLKKGWKPLRTILIASWDAEECELRSFISLQPTTADLSLSLSSPRPLRWTHRIHRVRRGLRRLDSRERRYVLQPRFNGSGKHFRSM